MDQDKQPLALIFQSGADKPMQKETFTTITNECFFQKVELFLSEIQLLSGTSLQAELIISYF